MKAVVLLSGGLDSAVTLHIAKRSGYLCRCLIFDYGQRHKKEIASALRVARAARCAAQIIKIILPWKGSSLLDKNFALPSRPKEGIPSTYVPGRNIIFLSFALSYAEASKAQAIFIGAHSEDYSGYPDCRRDFFRAFEKVISKGTKAGRARERIALKTPLINKSKAQIIRIGRRLAVPFALTWSCYRGGKKPCGTCDSCYFRAKGFAEEGLVDPLLG